MNTDLALFLMLIFGMLLGFVPAAVIYGRRYYKHIKSCKAVDQELYNLGITHGRAQILSDPAEIKKAYQYFFQNRP